MCRPEYRVRRTTDATRLVADNKRALRAKSIIFVFFLSVSRPTRISSDIYTQHANVHNKPAVPTSLPRTVPGKRGRPSSCFSIFLVSDLPRTVATRTVHDRVARTVKCTDVWRIAGVRTRVPRGRRSESDRRNRSRGRIRRFFTCPPYAGVRVNRTRKTVCRRKRQKPERVLNLFRAPFSAFFRSAKRQGRDLFGKHSPDTRGNRISRRNEDS